MSAADFFPWLLVLGGAFFAGAMNALAGGGTFFSFPALVAAGVPPVTANASNTVALWPASLSGAWAYRRELARHRRWVTALTLVALTGGGCGGLLLLALSNAAFARLVPWLLLIATALFACSRTIGKGVRALRAAWGKPQAGAQTSPTHAPGGGTGGLVFQFIVAVYGGFFGAGQGILTLAALAIQGIDDVQEQNALKNWISAVTYTVSALIFIAAGAISVPHTLAMLLTASVGGHAGARLARRLPALWLRRLVIAVGSSLTLIYFYKTYA